jgi:uncharacterized protein YfaS (alpha-2-macroglobulin family)
MEYIEPFIKGFNSRYTDNLLKDRERFIQDGITKLSQMQDYSGAFSYWRYGGYINIFASVYASDVLINLNNSSYKIPSYMMKKIYKNLTYLSKGHGVYHYGKTSKFIQLYASYLLSKQNRLPLSTANTLYDKKIYKNDLLKLYMMAAIMKNLHQNRAKNAVLKEIENLSLGGMRYDRDYGDDFYSKVRNIAFALYIHLENFEKNSLSYRLMDELHKEMDTIYSTQDRAFVMRALVMYYKNESDKGMDVSLKFNDKELDIDKKSIFQEPLKDAKIEINSHSGTVNYNIEVSQYLPKRPHHSISFAKNSPLSIMREYVDEKANPIDLSHIKQGELIYSKITIDNTKKLENIVIADRIPACFEIVNERVDKINRATNVRNSRNFTINYQDYRDDRVLSFVSLPDPLSQNEQKLTCKRLGYRWSWDNYRLKWSCSVNIDDKLPKKVLFTPLRVVSTGECKLPSVVAEVMYDSRITDYDRQRSTVRVIKEKKGASKRKDNLKLKW